MTDFFDVFLLKTVLSMATPLIFAAMGGLISEKSGVMNIALEGLMLIGAFFAVVGAHYLENAWAGVALGVLAAGATALIHAFWSITLKADQIVAATAIILLGSGITVFLLLRFFNQSGQSPRVDRLPTFWGSVSILVPVAFVLVPVVWWVLNRTKVGLHIQAAGESPKAAESVGINVNLYRYVCVTLSGVLAGLGGVFLSIGDLSLFSREMTQGRGFIALAAVIFGNWTPFGALAACLLFAAAQALPIQAQATGLGVNRDLLLALPYILTLVAIAGFVRKSRAPAGLGEHATSR
ncbi:MAG: ABC transporter permease [Chloroflexota bacterium]|nr:ABC transporter permease [Chloroflexota bacterium]